MPDVTAHFFRTNSDGTVSPVFPGGLSVEVDENSSGKVDTESIRWVREDGALVAEIFGYESVGPRFGAFRTRSEPEQQAYTSIEARGPNDVDSNAYVQARRASNTDGDVYVGWDSNGGTDHARKLLDNSGRSDYYSRFDARALANTNTSGFLGNTAPGSGAVAGVFNFNFTADDIGPWQLIVSASCFAPAGSTLAGLNYQWVGPGGVVTNLGGPILYFNSVQHLALPAYPVTVSVTGAGTFSVVIRNAGSTAQTDGNDVAYISLSRR